MLGEEGEGGAGGSTLRERGAGRSTLREGEGGGGGSTLRNSRQVYCLRCK